MVRGKVLPVLLVMLVAFLAYSASLGFELVWDDHHLVKHHSELARSEGPGALLTGSYIPEWSKEDAGYYRPVPAASLWIDSLLEPVLPISFHLSNVLMHVLNTALLFLLLAQIFSSSLAAWTGALLFAVHPVHVESVAFVSGRTDLLAAVFILLSVLYWFAARKGTPAIKTRLYLMMGAAAFFLACLSKETAFMLPALLTFWSLATRDRGSGTGKWLIANLGWAAAWGAALVAAMALRMAVLDAPWGGAASSAAARSAAFPGIVLKYMKLAVFPWPQKTFYTPDDLGLSFFTVFGAALFLLLAWAAGWRGRTRAGLLGTSWFFLFLLPVSGIFPTGSSVIAERFMYIPTIGVCILLASLLEEGRFSESTRKAIYIGALALAVLMSAAGISFMEKWRDDVSLYTALSEDAPRHPIGPYNLGKLAAQVGAHQLAIPQLREALARDPGHPGARFLLASSLRDTGELDEAETLYRGLMAVKPDVQEIPQELGFLLLGSGRSVEAMELFDKAETLGRMNPRLLMGQILARIELGDGQGALELFRDLEVMDPETADRNRELVMSAVTAGED
jgi:hypothetical protein